MSVAFHVFFDIPTGIPLVYELDSQLNSIRNFYIGDEENIAKKILKTKSNNDFKN